MAYQIRYSNVSAIKEVKTIKNKPLLKWTAAFYGILFMALMLRLKPVQDFLIPGDPDVTRAAFFSFKQELKSGEDFRDAAAVFCRQVIESDILE